jgi:Phytanoyl-CoA dioxygenase (PhyH)
LLLVVGRQLPALCERVEVQPTDIAGLTLTTPAPPAPELRVANEHLDDNVTLERLLAAEGYLFFRNVLDVAAVAAARAEMMHVLQRLDLIEPGAQLPIATSTLNAEARQDGMRLLDEEGKKLRIFQKFVAVPANRAFFEKIVGGPVGFAPIVFYRSRPPGWAVGGWHQDGFYNQGFGLHTAWIPVMDIDTELGGMCIAPGLEKAGYLQDPELWNQSIPPHRIPRELHRRSDYHPGDLLIFKEFMPHTGIPNCSTQNLYRLSFDIRFYPAGNRAFLEGELAEVDHGSIVIDCDDGMTRRLEITPETILWSGREDMQTGLELSSWAQPNEGRVMARCDGDRGVYVRLFKDRFP